MLTKGPEGSLLQLSWQPKQLRVLIVLATLGLCAFFAAQGSANLIALKLLPYRASASAAARSKAANERKHDHGEYPKAVEIGEGRRLLLTHIIECLQSQLPGSDRIAGLLKEHRACLVGERLHGRVKGVEIFAKAKTVELLALLMQGLAQRCPDAAPLVAQKV